MSAYVGVTYIATEKMCKFNWYLQLLQVQDCARKTRALQKHLVQQNIAYVK